MTRVMMTTTTLVMAQQLGQLGLGLVVVVVVCCEACGRMGMHPCCRHYRCYYRQAWARARARAPAQAVPCRQQTETET